MAEKWDLSWEATEHSSILDRKRRLEVSSCLGLQGFIHIFLRMGMTAASLREHWLEPVDREESTLYLPSKCLSFFLSLPFFFPLLCRSPLILPPDEAGGCSGELLGFHQAACLLQQGLLR